MLDFADHYAQLNREIREILADVPCDFSSVEIEEIEEFLNAREFGLALETISAILMEFTSLPKNGVVDRIFTVADQMGVFNAPIFTEMLPRFKRENLQVAL